MNPPEETDPRPPFTKRTFIKRAAIILLPVAAVIGFAYWLYSRTHEWTDDAMIDAHIMQISSKVAGQVSRVAVEDNRTVKKGDLLVEIDPRDFQVRLNQARASLAAAEAEARRAEADAARNKLLFQRDQISRQVFDRVTADADVAKARADLERQKVAGAELELSYTKITSPEAGRVTKRAVEIQSFVQVGQPLMAVVPDRVWVIANFKETQIEKIRPGQPVKIKIDTYPGKTFPGRVDGIQSGSGARFSLLPPENATGNFVKVVQRIPVKIVFDEQPTGILLVPGMSVVPVVSVK
jgi:membrane fusion protein (multidrug efflux system)